MIAAASEASSTPASPLNSLADAPLFVSLTLTLFPSFTPITSLSILLLNGLVCCCCWRKRPGRAPTATILELGCGQCCTTGSGYRRWLTLLAHAAGSRGGRLCHHYVLDLPLQKVDAARVPLAHAHARGVGLRQKSHAHASMLHVLHMPCTRHAHATCCTRHACHACHANAMHTMHMHMHMHTP